MASAAQKLAGNLARMGKTPGMTLALVERRGRAVTWHLYVIRTVGGCLYTGIATDVRRRYREHAKGGPKSAKFLRAHPPRELVFARRLGSRSLALKVEYWFKQLSKPDKETLVRAGKLRIDRTSGKIRRPAKNRRTMGI